LARTRGDESAMMELDHHGGRAAAGGRGCWSLEALEVARVPVPLRPLGSCNSDWCLSSLISSGLSRPIVFPDNHHAPEARSLVMEPSSMRGFHHGYVLVEEMNVAHNVLDVMGRGISIQIDELNSPH